MLSNQDLPQLLAIISRRLPILERNLQRRKANRISLVESLKDNIPITLTDSLLSNTTRLRALLLVLKISPPLANSLQFQMHNLPRNRKAAPWRILLPGHWKNSRSPTLAKGIQAGQPESAHSSSGVDEERFSTIHGSESGSSTTTSQLAIRSELVRLFTSDASDLKVNGGSDQLAKLRPGRHRRKRPNALAQSGRDKLANSTHARMEATKSELKIFNSSKFHDDPVRGRHGEGARDRLGLPAADDGGLDVHPVRTRRACGT